MNPRAGFFFDRDGVVNMDPHPEPYVLSWQQWRWQPEIHELLQVVKDRGFATILVTSQRGVGKRLMSQEDLDAIHERMQSELGDLAFDAIHAFTGTPESPFPAKPDPAMVLAGLETLDLDPAQSWLIGDADRDIAMGRKAGLGTLVRFRGLKDIGIEADITIDRIGELTEFLDGSASR